MKSAAETFMDLSEEKKAVWLGEQLESMTEVIATLTMAVDQLYDHLGHIPRPQKFADQMQEVKDIIRGGVSNG